jgi:hypothetical protein
MTLLASQAVQNTLQYLQLHTGQRTKGAYARAVCFQSYCCFLKSIQISFTLKSDG